MRNASESGRTERKPGARELCFPNVIVIGAQKCGTSSMHRYLNWHPSISMSRVKEINFFIEGHNWRHGLGWYSRHFDSTAPVRGESSPSYTAVETFPGVASKIAQVIPDVKLIYMVRDPIERLISHYVHAVSKGSENRSISAVARDRNYLERSMYWLQIREYLEYFQTSRILVVETDDLRRERAATMRQVFRFLGVNADFFSNMFHWEHHRSRRKRRKTKIGLRIASSRFGRWIESVEPPWQSRIRNIVYFPFSRLIERPTLTESDRRELVSQLSDDAAAFREWTGRPFDAWSV